MSEVAYLKANNLGFENLADTVVALRVTTNQVMHCYVTSGQKHAMHLIRHAAGFTQYYFDINKFAQIVKPNAPLDSIGEWLICLDLVVRKAEESISRHAIGDTKSYLMTILGILAGCMSQFGVEQRQGFEQD